MAARRQAGHTAGMTSTNGRVTAQDGPGALAAFLAGIPLFAPPDEAARRGPGPVRPAQPARRPGTGVGSTTMSMMPASLTARRPAG